MVGVGDDGRTAASKVVRGEPIGLSISHIAARLAPFFSRPHNVDSSLLNPNPSVLTEQTLLIPLPLNYLPLQPSPSCLHRLLHLGLPRTAKSRTVPTGWGAGAVGTASLVEEARITG